MAYDFKHCEMCGCDLDLATAGVMWRTDGKRRRGDARTLQVLCGGSRGTCLAETGNILDQGWDHVGNLVGPDGRENGLRHAATFHRDDMNEARRFFSELADVAERSGVKQRLPREAFEMMWSLP